MLFWAILTAELWRATAIVFVILVAGVQLVPKEFEEAASVFGATSWQRFRRVTLPLLRPSIQTALILRTVLAFETFAVVLAIGGTNFPGADQPGLHLAKSEPGLRHRGRLCGDHHGGLAGGDRGLSDGAASARG